MKMIITQQIWFYHEAVSDSNDKPVPRGFFICREFIRDVLKIQSAKIQVSISLKRPGKKGWKMFCVNVDSVQISGRSMKLNGTLSLTDFQTDWLYKNQLMNRKFWVKMTPIA